MKQCAVMFLVFMLLLFEAVSFLNISEGWLKKGLNKSPFTKK